MRLLLNVLWFVFAGLWLAIGYAFAALICFILIITIPFGVAALRIGLFALWPFGRTVVRRPDAGAGSAIGNSRRLRISARENQAEQGRVSSKRPTWR
jgi:uncharacterized membrane protein YccF (DUF307 family)